MRSKVLWMIVLAAVSLTLGAMPSLAQEEVLMSDQPSECDVFGALSGIEKEGCDLARTEPAAGTIDIGGDTQGLSVANPSATAGGPSQSGAGSAASGNVTTAATGGTSGGTTATPRAATFPSIQFEFNSAELTPTARRTLETVAAVLKDPYFENRWFIIEGHTDAVGSPAYNQKLSQQRAEAVVEYLVRQSGIAGDRLVPRGKGESEPYDARDPEAAINRRVSVLVTGS